MTILQVLRSLSITMTHTANAGASDLGIPSPGRSFMRPSLPFHADTASRSSCRAPRSRTGPEGAISAGICARLAIFQALIAGPHLLTGDVGFEIAAPVSILRRKAGCFK